jgi:Fur family zinc uptake transcriptional regulator
MLAAESRCQHQHKKLTPQRRQILELMLKAGAAVTAYQLIDAYREAHLKTVPPVTIYRALEFLLDTGNIHRLDSSNQYTVCRHLGCGHVHETTQFLICNHCAGVDEVAVSRQTIDEFRTNAESAGFRIERMQFETHGLCLKCRQEGHG